jgi:hypothetical protein
MELLGPADRRYRSGKERDSGNRDNKVGMRACCRHYDEWVVIKVVNGYGLEECSDVL